MRGILLLWLSIGLVNLLSIKGKEVNSSLNTSLSGQDKSLKGAFSFHAGQGACQVFSRAARLMEMITSRLEGILAGQLAISRKAFTVQTGNI